MTEITKKEALAQIEDHRAAIDAIDEHLVALLNEREAHSMAVRTLKPTADMELFDPDREDRIFDKIAGLNKGPLTDGSLREIYTTLLKVMKENPAL